MNKISSDEVAARTRLSGPGASASFAQADPHALQEVGRTAVGPTEGFVSLAEPASGTVAVRSAPINRLPDELMTDILGRVDDYTLARVQATSQRFAAIAVSPDLPLVRRQVLEKAVVAAHSLPQPFAEQQVRHLFGDHLVHVSEHRAVEDACAWIEILSTEVEKAGASYGNFRAGLFGPCLRAALMTTSADLREMCEAPPQINLLTTLEGALGLEEVALDLLPFVRKQLLDTPLVLWGPLASARRLGLRISLEDRQRTTDIALLDERGGRVMSGVPPLFDDLSHLQPEDRSSWFLDRLSDHQQPVFDLFCGEKVFFDWLRGQVPSYVSDEQFLLFQRAASFLFAEDFSSAEADRFFKLLSSAESAAGREDFVEPLTGRLAKLGDETEIYLRRMLQEMGPHALLMHVLEVITRESAGAGDATPSQTAERRAQLRQQYPQQPALALAQIRNRYPQLAQVVVDHLHLLMADAFLDLRRAARDGDESPFAELYFAELAAATQTEWPDIVPSQIQQGAV